MSIRLRRFLSRLAPKNTPNLNLENKDVLQINATIIAGALVFITLVSFSTNVSHGVSLPVTPGIVLGSVTVLLFSQSSYFVLSGDRQGAISAMRRAFIILFIMMLSYLILALWQVDTPIIQELAKRLNPG